MFMVCMTGFAQSGPRARALGVPFDGNPGPLDAITDVKGVEGVVTQIECPPEEPLLAELRAFFKSVETRQKPLADGWAGYDAVRVLDAALQSAKSGQIV